MNDKLHKATIYFDRNFKQAEDLIDEIHSKIEEDKQHYKSIEEIRKDELTLLEDELNEKF